MIKVIGAPIEWDKPVTAEKATKPPSVATKPISEGTKPGRPAKYGSDAERKRAYKARNRDRLSAIRKASVDLKRKMVAADG